MKIRRSALQDTVVVKTRSGESSYGEVFNGAITVRCQIDETRRLVRADNGDETVSEATLLLHPKTKTTVVATGALGVADPMDLFTAQSEVLIGNRTSRVLSSKQLKLRGYVHAVEVTCA